VDIAVKHRGIESQDESLPLLGLSLPGAPDRRDSAFMGAVARDTASLQPLSRYPLIGNHRRRPRARKVCS